MHRIILPFVLPFVGALVLFCFCGCQRGPSTGNGQSDKPAAPQGIYDNPNVTPIMDPLVPPQKVGDATPEEIAQIRDVFATFRGHVMAYRGDEAAQMLSESSLQYYEKLIRTARTAIHHPDDYRVLSPHLSPSVRTTVELMKSRLSADFLDTATPTAVYATAFKQGWIGYKSMTTASLGQFAAYDNMGKRYVTADFYYAGTFDDKLIMRIAFVKENGAWKVDLVPIFIAVDQTIRDFIEEKQLNEELSLEKTVQDSQDALEPAQWKMYSYQQGHFAIRFPRPPEIHDEATERVFTSSHYRYGQFVVIASTYPNTPDSPKNNKTARDRAIVSFLHPMGASRPECSSSTLDGDMIVRCNVTFPSHESRGIAVWVFADERQYVLFNQARNDAFSDQAAKAFLDSFTYE